MALVGELEKGPATGYAKANRGNGKPILGNIEEMGDLIFKFNTKDQAEMFLRTQERLADYVGVEVSPEMRALVKNGTEKTFTEPRIPRVGDQEASQGQLEKYKLELKQFQEDKRKYDTYKGKTFIMILGQCSETLSNRLKNDTDFSTLESNFDVKGLMDKLRSLAFSKSGNQNTFLAAQEALKRLMCVNQGPTETNENFLKRTKALVQVVEEHWGDFSPEKLRGTGANSTQVARDKMLAMIYLVGSDNKRYGGLKDDLNNQYLAKHDNYPASLDEANTLLTHYQDEQVSNGRKGNNNGGLSFASVRKGQTQKWGSRKGASTSHPRRNRGAFETRQSRSRSRHESGSDTSEE